MSMDSVAMDIGCSTCAVRNLRQRFQATGHMENRPPSLDVLASRRVAKTAIFGIPTSATAANTHGTHSNHISAQTLRNRLREGGLGARRPYLACVLPGRHHVNPVNRARTRPMLA